jgi:WD40 repeat protein
VVVSAKPIAAVALGIGIYIWDAETGGLVLKLPELYPQDSEIVLWSPDGRLLGESYRIRDGDTGNETLIFQNCPYSRTLDWHPSSNYLAVYGERGVYICDVRDDRIVTMLHAGQQPRNDVVLLSHLYALDWNPDGRRLAAVDKAGVVRIFEVTLPE